MQVARVFYSKLFESGGVPDSGGGRVVHAEDVDMPLNWAQFVHFGA